MEFLHQWQNEKGYTSINYPVDKQMSAEVTLGTVEGYLETSQVLPK